MVHFGPFWSEDVVFGPFGSAHFTAATPDTFMCTISVVRLEKLRLNTWSLILDVVERLDVVSSSKDAHAPFPSARCGKMHHLVLNQAASRP